MIEAIDDLAQRIYEGVRAIHHPKDINTGRPVTLQWSALPAKVRNEYRLIATIAKQEIERDGSRVQGNGAGGVPADAPASP